MSGVVDCPSCGHKVRLPEGLAGLLLRCPKCSLTFLASTSDKRERTAPPLGGDDEREPPSWHRPETETGLRRCLRCGARLRPGAVRCPDCERTRTDDDEEGASWHRPPPLLVRRDCEQHRGRFIMSLGTISVVCGALSMCLFGVGSIPGLALGITAWVLGNSDLDKMHAGLMDPEGIGSTKNGRDCGIFGTVLSSIFGIGWLMYLVFGILLDGLLW
jgi:ssDNA-binding Zn-finger/Zn-ribbon topoisomerase 1